MPKLILLGGEDVSARIEIAKKLSLLGYEITILGTEKEERFLKNGIRYSRYSLNRELNVIDDLKTILELRTILKGESTQTIVHAFDTKPTMFLPLAALGQKQIKVVRTITGMGRIFTEESVKNSFLKYLYNLIQRVVSRRVDFTIFQNDDDADYYIGKRLIEQSRAGVVKSSGIDLAEFSKSIDRGRLQAIEDELKLPPGRLTFILVSRMVRQKGILDYLEAAKKCYENGHSFNFLLVGQLDSDGSVTLEQINAYSRYVHFLGRREDVKELLSLSDVFVLPTYYREGVPRVLLEASATGLALIATDMPGCKDVVVDGYNGKLVKVQDPDDLYKKMLYVSEDNERLHDFSVNAKEKVKEFDLEIVTNKYDKVYKSLSEEL
ncbi:MAG: hypothetical protein BV458_07020 [Thermoplasmata archaeon M9B2D]|nr:MAG: hypothetical protein BV458_07020 [Thermoplasmata archaeon M9B2D]